MANIPSNNQKNNSLDLVKRNEVLKAQVFLEEKARREWNRKWGFLLNFDKIVLEEARKQGVSEADYRRWTVRRKSKSRTVDETWDVKTSESFPKTSSGRYIFNFYFWT
ncbi:hypothetical protein Zmor_008275 [Zophobas morio]|uniref:Uncharacterized protein n=1 Tax=Zophobas morio TaxID=2755281 RepID=A0AA38J242_9CUCU|nr:hypothetical protein Zmor_008275 [Zophobas morio]